MTVETDTNRVQYATNGTTGPWSVPFYFLADADLRVVYADSTGEETELTLTTEYSVTGAANPAGGSVTTVASYVAGGTITVVRELEALQPTDYSDTDAFPAASLERNLDRLTMLAQQQAEISARSIVLPVSDESSVTIPSATERASKILAFDAGGELALVAPTSGDATDLALDLASASSSTKGAGQVGFSHDIAYAAGTVGALSAGTISPHNAPWNCDRTGAADCTANLLACIAYAKANSLEVAFASGTYKYATTITLDWTRARVRFNGKVTLQYTGTGKAVSIDGGASGSLFDVRFGESNAPLIRCDSGTHGVYVRSLGHGVINADVLSAGTAGLLVEFAVACEFGIRCTKNAQSGANWVSTVPVNGMILNKRNAGEGVADCVFKNCIIEGTSGTGVTGDFIYRCTFLGGTSEGNTGGGYAETVDSGGNTLIEFFCEANGGADFTLSGSDSTTLIRCTNGSTTTASSITRAAVLDGGEFDKLTISGSSVGTVLRGVLLFPSGFTDSGIKTVFENVKYITSVGAPVIPDAARKPKMKRIGALPISAATKATRCVVTIANHRLDYGESIAIASVGGMTDLNGNTYQVEPIDETDSVYLLSGGAYVNSTAFGTYTSGGTATYVGFNSSWAVGGGSYRDPGFFKDQSGIVHLFGAVKGSTLSGVAAFTLPAGFRPGAVVTYPAWELTPSAALVQITSAGVVTPSSYSDGANKVVSLDGISFQAEG